MRLAYGVAIAMLITVGCHDETPTREDDLALLANMLLEIRAIVSDAPCRGVGDCASIAIGAKPCGGPWAYLVYSRSSVDERELERRVDEYTRFNRVVNDRWNLFSDCLVVLPPDVGCVSGRCVDRHQLYSGAGQRAGR